MARPLPLLVSGSAAGARRHCNCDSELKTQIWAYAHRRSPENAHWNDPVNEAVGYPKSLLEVVCPAEPNKSKRALSPILGSSRPPTISLPITPRPDQNDPMDAVVAPGLPNAQGDDNDYVPLPVVDNPSNDIRADISRIFAQNLDFQGSYYFQKTGSDAPNPLLRLHGLGRIGLPLSEREAKHIISHSQQAPFGKGERTLVDPSVRDTWEMDASKVAFDNPTWTTYLYNIVAEICTTLGVNHAASQPRCELYKLLLYETGSHFLPHQDTEKVPGMFATIIVILPSEFTGGSVHLSHDGLSSSIDFAQDSGFNTSVISWYTDVVHEVKPITSGYRLALSYNLIHTTTAVRPSLSASSAALRPLKHALLSWQQTLANAPSKLLYLLQHKYAQASLSGSALKGKDAHIVAMLTALARECQIKIGLASVECHIRGSADDYPGKYGKWGRYSKYIPDFCDIDSNVMEITGLVDLKGTKLKEELSVGQDDEDEDEDGGETIPANLKTSVENGKVDQEEYEGYQGNYAGQIDKWYRRTVLVIWPLRKNNEVLHGTQFAEYAIERLEAVSHPKASREERDLVDYLLSLSNEEREEYGNSILGALCHAAAEWKDEELWLDAFEKGRGYVALDRLGVDGWTEALLRIGLDVVLPHLQETITSDESNAERFTFLDEMTSRLAEQEDPSVKDWIIQEREVVMQSMKPISVRDTPIFIAIAGKEGGLTVMRDAFIPQIKATSKPKDVISLVTTLHAEKILEDGLLRNPEDAGLRNDLVRDLLSWAVVKVDFFEKVEVTVPAPNSIYGYARPPTRTLKPTSDIAKTFIEACCATGNDFLVEGIVLRLIKTRSTAGEEASQRMAEVFVPLLVDVNTILGGRPRGSPRVPGVEQLYRHALPTLLQERVAKGFKEDDIKSLMNAVVLCGVDLLKQPIVPTFKKGAKTVAEYMWFVRETHRRREDIGDQDGYLSTMIHDVLKDLISRVPAENFKGPVLVDVLSTLLDFNDGRLVDDLLGKALNPTSLTESHVKTILAPALADLTAFMDRRQVARTTQPYANFLKAIALAWFRLVLGSKPSEIAALLSGVRGIQCTCVRCRQLVAFFGNDKPSVAFTRIGAVAARHLDTQLYSVLRNTTSNAVATWKIVRTTPQGFEVSKTDQILKGLRWPTLKQEALQLLKRISTDEATLATILGQQYAGLCLRLEVQSINHPPPTTVLPHSVPTSSNQVAKPSAPSSAVPSSASIPGMTGRPAPRPAENDEDVVVIETPAAKRRKVDHANLEVIDLTSD